MKKICKMKCPGFEDRYSCCYSCKIREKIDCINVCFPFEEGIPYGKCGFSDLEQIKNKQDELKRKWLEALGPGWPCEVLNDNYNYYTVMYFYSITDKNIFFVTRKKKDISQSIHSYKEFRPLSTPLDFIDENIRNIQINNNSKSYRHIRADSSAGSWTPWPNCPEGMGGKTLAIPDDWRPKCSSE